MAVANTLPANITFKKTIILSTVDQNNNDAPINEGYIVTGPISLGVTPISIAGGTKLVIPLSTTSGNGAPYLKIHLPTSPNGNTLYLTYAVGNNQMADGYYDYKTGVPAAYYNALRAWIKTNPATNQPYAISNTPRVRTLKFLAYGSATNKPANAVTFYIKFQGIFSASASNTAVVVNTAAIATR